MVSVNTKTFLFVAHRTSCKYAGAFLCVCVCVCVTLAHANNICKHILVSLV